MTAFLTAHLSDAGIALALIALAVLVALACTAAALAANVQGKRTDLPGALGESDWPEVDDWERHVQSTPGVGDLGETPIFEQLCVDLWDADLGSDGSDAA